MPDKKLTDKEIVKALNECLSFEMVETMTDLKLDDIVDLINRLQAENEKLSKQCDCYDKILKCIKTEAFSGHKDPVGEKGDCGHKSICQAEAYKEFVDKFLEKAISTRNYFEIKSLATTVLNELVGDNNE